MKTLRSGSVLVDYGPMHMLITVKEGPRPLTELAREGGAVAMRVLGEIARCLPVIRRKAHEIEVEQALPEVVRRMVEATRKMEQPDLTPLAAVAGAASDVVADFLLSRGGTKIIVDNGGDIAIRLRAGEAVRVGVKTDILARNPSHLLTIDAGMGIGGIATSGLGGRSLTKGIASAATVLSANATLSDAAATVVGNDTVTEAPQITRALAEEIYPDTDLAGEWVTMRVGRLSPEKVEEALGNGLRKARSLFRKGSLFGALVAVQGEVRWTDFLDGLLSRLP